MSDLFEKSIKTLELPAVLELLSRHAVSDEAKARCLRKYMVFNVKINDIFTLKILI